MNDKDRNVEDVESKEARRARRQEILRERRKAIKALRKTGMTDEEIAEAVGGLVDIADEDDDVIDAEIVSVEEDVDAVDDKSQPMVNGEAPKTRALVPVTGLPANGNDRETSKPKRYSEEWWEAASFEQQKRRCRARSTRHGGQCGHPAIKGATVCRNHGGAAPQVKLAARIRLEMAADRMAANLLRLGTDAESESVRLGATNSALDRLGILKPTEVVLSPGERKPYEDIFVDISSGSRAESRARRGLTDEGEMSGSLEDGGLNRSANGFDVSLDDYADTDLDDDFDDGQSSTETSGFDDKVYTADGRLIGPEPRDFDRPSGQPGPRPNASQMAAEDAVAAANRANAQAGALRAIESPHKRYRRP